MTGRGGREGRGEGGNTASDSVHKGLFLFPPYTLGMTKHTHHYERTTCASADGSSWTWGFGAPPFRGTHIRMAGPCKHTGGRAERRQAEASATTAPAALVSGVKRDAKDKSQQNRKGKQPGNVYQPASFLARGTFDRDAVPRRRDYGFREVDVRAVETRRGGRGGRIHGRGRMKR